MERCGGFEVEVVNSSKVVERDACKTNYVENKEKEYEKCKCYDTCACWASMSWAPELAKLRYQIEIT